ncbi:MAG: hypothetical protein ACP5NW_03870 [Candidatus Woesearchaeota archaeon]
MKFSFGEIRNKPIIWVILIFAIVLALRLYIAFQTPLFNYDAYFTLRQVENIKDTGVPLYNDPLSYGGKSQLFAPLHYYTIALFSILMPVETASKIVPNIMAALIVFVIYFMSLKLTKSSKISIFTSFISGFLPIYLIDINRASINYLAILLMFLIAYSMMRLNDRKYVDYALIFMFLLVLTTPMAFILVIGLLIYLLLLKLENYAVEMKELEIILFFTFLVFWVNLLIYKNAFLTHGLLVIWKNVPVTIMSNFFGNLGFIQALGAISIIPIVFGAYAFYSALHLERNKEVIILMSLGLSISILLWFKLVDLISGLTVLGMTLVALMAYSLKQINEFIEKSKIHKYEKILHISLVALSIITITPAVWSIVFVSDIGPMDIPSITDVQVMQWAAENIPKTAVITAGLEEGNMIAYYGERKNVMDTNFLLTPSIDQRYNDLNEIYTTNFETKAIGIFNKYNSKYIFVTKNTLDEYNIQKVAYISDKECFTPVFYREESYLYKVECKIR